MHCPEQRLWYLKQNNGIDEIYGENIEKRWETAFSRMNDPNMVGIWNYGNMTVMKATALLGHDWIRLTYWQCFEVIQQYENVVTWVDATAMHQNNRNATINSGNAAKNH